MVAANTPEPDRHWLAFHERGQEGESKVVHPLATFGKLVALFPEEKRSNRLTQEWFLFQNGGKLANAWAVCHPHFVPLQA